MQNGYPTPDAPMRINVNGPMTMGQLARLYSNGNPGLSSQTQSYVNQQASIQGISGGVGNYFAGERQNASNQVAALQMQQQRAYELAGRANPANQYAQQLAIADQAGAMRQQDAQIQQAQAFATRQRQFAEPADGSTPHLSPLQTQEAARQGMGGRAYLADQRLGSLRAYVDPKTSGRLPTTGVSPEDLYAHSSFQNALKRDPERSGQIFEALTGTKFHDEKTQDGVIAGWHSSYM